MAQTITLTFTKADIKKLLETQVWKLGRATETDANPKQIYNLSADEGSADSLIVNDSLNRRMNEAFEAISEYTNIITPTSTQWTVTLTMPSAWASTADELTEAMKGYVVAGMNYDWLIHVFPSEASKYVALMNDYKAKITRTLYAIKAPQFNS